ncbi:hypothetical protein FI667_g734, partial [Globisporangium splendens]
MDDILERLGALANDAPVDSSAGGSGSRLDHALNISNDERITEAQALWRTLETLLTAAKSQELSVGDATLTKLLSCARTVLVKLGCRGEREREALVRGGVAELLVASMQHESDSTIASRSVLQVLQTLAFDAKNRQALVVAETLPFYLSLVKRHPRDLHVQLFGCKFLQFMVYEEECKDKMMRYGAINAVLDALYRFPSDAQMSVSAPELIYFLSMELESAMPTEQQFASTMEDIIESVIAAMRLHVQQEQVQTNGIGILNGFVVHANTKRLLCAKPIWEIVLSALLSSGNESESTSEAIELLEALLSDPITFNTVETIQQLKALRTKLESLSGVKKKASEASFTVSRLQVLIGPRQSSSSSGTATTATATPAVVNVTETETGNLQPDLNRLLLPPETDGGGNHQEANAQSIPTYGRHDDNDGEIPVAAAKTHYSAIEKESRSYHESLCLSASSVSRDLNELAETLDIEYQDVQHGLVHTPEISSTQFLEDLALDSDSVGYFEQFLRDVDSRFKPSAPREPSLAVEAPTKTGQRFAVAWPFSWRNGNSSVRDFQRGDSSSGGSDTWRDLYEACAEEMKALKAEYHNLQENYKILSRRAQEQSKLLNLQNSRIRNHMGVHEHVLGHVKKLEEALQEPARKHQVERELRLAEVAQSEKISMALHEAMKEIKALNSQNSSASRELMQKEKLRIDYQQKASEVKHMKQKLELERDDAMIQAQTMKFEQIGLHKQLEDCRREGMEALLMREEDVDAPKPRIFASIGRSTNGSPSKNSRGNMATSWTAKRSSAFDSTSHRNSNCGPFTIQPIDTSAPRQFRTYRERRSPSKAAFDRLETDIAKDPDTIDRDEIEMSLKTIYQSLDTSLEGNSVHIASVRRFFLDSGIVQSPVVAGDVDVVLAKVLTQAQENRRKTTVRKDYAFAQTAPVSQANEAKKFRYFDEDTFNEAVTLVGMKRFPRYEIKRVLQAIVADYLYPIQRRMRASSMLANTCNNSNGSTASFSSSTSSGYRSSILVGGNGASFCGSPGANSPLSICIGVMHAILNGLAPHIGRGGEYPRFTGNGEIDEEELRTQMHVSAGPTTDRTRKRRRDEVIYSMLEMHSILAREQKPLGTICEFYSAIHRQSAAKDELLGLSFELLLNFAMDFEITPSFMDRVSLKHLDSEMAGFIKSYLALHKEFPRATDLEALKKVAFSMALARVAIELFSAKVDCETPEKQVTGLLQWIDNSVGREKIMRKAMLPLVIKFSRKLYALKVS